MKKNYIFTGIICFTCLVCLACSIFAVIKVSKSNKTESVSVTMQPSALPTQVVSQNTIETSEGSIEMYWPSTSDKQEVPIDEIALHLHNGWRIDEIYTIQDENQKEYRFVKSEIEKGAVISVDEAVVLARDYCRKNMPLSEEDKKAYMENFDFTKEDLIYEPALGCFLDYNGQRYLVSVDYPDFSAYISVDKMTGEAKECGGGHDYWRGAFDF